MQDRNKDVLVCENDDIFMDMTIWCIAWLGVIHTGHGNNVLIQLSNQYISWRTNFRRSHVSPEHKKIPQLKIPNSMYKRSWQSSTNLYVSKTVSIGGGGG